MIKGGALSEIHTTNDILEYVVYYNYEGSNKIISTTKSDTTGNNQEIYYYQDRLGSTKFITDDSGNILQNYEYDDYGKIRKIETVNNSGTTILDELNNLLTDRLYAGYTYDKEIDLYFLKNRHYSAELGRFLQTDPIEEGDDVNLYVYTKNNPLNWVDPEGTEGDCRSTYSPEQNAKFKKVLYGITIRFNILWQFFKTKYDTVQSIAFGSYIAPFNDVIFNNELFAKYAIDDETGDIKKNQNFRKSSIYIKQPKISPDKPETWWGKMIVIDGQGYWLTDFGDLLFGFNGYHAGFDLSYVNFGARAKLVKDKGRTKANDDKKNNEPKYKAGYNLAVNLNGGFVTSKNILDALKSVYLNNPAIGNERIPYTKLNEDN